MKLHVHMVSDATGETVLKVAEACWSQFEDVDVIEHTQALVRTPGQIRRVIEQAKKYPGVVLYTLADKTLRQDLAAKCKENGIPSVDVLSPTMDVLSGLLGLQARPKTGGQHIMDKEYFKRIEAMDFSLAHDDGQSMETLAEADVIIVGVSRTSKTPTCLYLGNKGVKAANVPLVPHLPPPQLLTDPHGPLVVALTRDPKSLSQIRQSRLSVLGQTSAMAFDAAKRGGHNYAEYETVRDEVAAAKRLFLKHGWPIIDVTRKSIEEAAAKILTLLQKHQAEQAAHRAHEEGTQNGRTA